MPMLDKERLKDAMCVACGNGVIDGYACNGENCTMLNVIDEQTTIEDIDRAAILRLCNEIEMIIDTVCNTGYTLQQCDIEAIYKRTKAITAEISVPPR